MASGENGGFVYADLIDRELADEQSRSAGFEQRGLAVITTSGTLATLLAGLVAVASGSDELGFAPEAKGALVAALALFVVASFFGLMVNAPGLTNRPAPLELKRLLDQGWEDLPEFARRSVAHLRVQILSSVRELNKTKAARLKIAIELEIGAVAALTVMVISVVSNV